MASNRAIQVRARGQLTLDELDRLGYSATVEQSPLLGSQRGIGGDHGDETRGDDKHLEIASRLADALLSNEQVVVAVNVFMTLSLVLDLLRLLNLLLCFGLLILTRKCARRLKHSSSGKLHP